MRAIALTGFDVAPEVQDLPVPEPGPGEVLVRVGHSSLNGFDLTVASGKAKDWMEHRFPVVLGRDFSGTVEAVGDGVTSVAPGDDVFGVVSHKYLGPGGFAEFTVALDELGLAKVPAGLEPAIAGVLGLAGAAAHATIEAVSPSSGDTVLVGGATGGVGAIALQLAVARGAQVIATAKPGEETEFVRGLGAHHTVDYTGDLAAQVRAITPDGVHAAIHLAGDGLQLAELVAEGGRFASSMGLGQDEMTRKDISATAIRAQPTTEVLVQLGAEVAAGRLQVPVKHTYKLEEVPQALDDFAKGSLGKLAIHVQG
ncbi:MAG TPA: NADP-dependent oxidoreductase [Actinomycetota bacterium]|nr:NADP-dependent oxidoreductase [Actinomycetota bacterium]